MAGNDLSVAIIAQTADFQAKMALATAASRDFEAQMRRVATQIQKTGDPTGDLASRLNSLAMGGATAKAQTEQLSSGLAALRNAGEDAASSQGRLQLATAGSTREIIVLAHEMLQGRFSRIPGSVMVLGERMGSLHGIIAGITPTMIAAAAGALGFAAAMYEIARSAGGAQEALITASRAFQFAGLPESRAQIGEWTELVRNMPGVSGETAGKIVAAWSQVRDATPQLVGAILRQLPALGQTEEEIAQANQKLAESFKDLGGAGLKFLEGLTSNADTLQRYKAAVETGDRGQAMSILLAQIGANAAKVTNGLGNAATAVRSFWESLSLGLSGAAGGVEQVRQLSDALDADKLKQVADAIKSAQASESGNTGLRSQKSIEADAAAIKEQVGASNAEIAREELQFWQGELDTAERFGGDVVGTMAKVVAARHALADAQKQDATAATAADKNWADNEFEFWRMVDEQASKSAADITRALQQNGREAQDMARKNVEANKEMEEAARRAATETQREWQKALAPLTTGFDGFVSGVLSGQQSIAQAAASSFEKMAEQFIEEVAKMIAQWLAFEALTAMGAGGIASAIGLTNPFGAGAGGLGGLLGGLLGGGGGAAAGGGGAGWMAEELAPALIPFDVGAWNIPKITPAILHPGEMVMPAPFAASFRSAVSSPAGDGGSGEGGGAPNVNIPVTIMAQNQQTMLQALRDPTVMRGFVAAFNRYVRGNSTMN